MMTATSARRLPWWAVALVAVIASVLGATASWASPADTTITRSYSYDGSQQLSPRTDVALVNSLATIVDGSRLPARSHGRPPPPSGFVIAAEGATGAGRTTAVIGRQVDTAVAKDWAGHEVLDLPAKEWTLAKNDQWVSSVIGRKMPVYVGSPTTWPNLWDAAAGRATVFGRELQQFTNAGYTWDGWTMLPPGGG